MTPPPIDKDEKKIKILKAAMDVFAEKGFHTARMADVAKVAKIGKGKPSMNILEARKIFLWNSSHL